ncbi:MAG: nuclear transport factor 2 family protein [Erythrobacter sp.]
MSRLLAALGFVALAACAHPAAHTPQHHPDTVSAYVEAYNTRNLEAMSALMHDDVQWLAVEGDKVEVVANGKSDLTRQMRDYIGSSRATTSMLDGRLKDGRFIAVREVASWIDGDGRVQSQSSLAVYELEAGLVRRVWYYPSSR